ncbi:hypothetical protein V1509DRAFT_9022 [Lipomyces kononenkoae]
MKTTSHLLSITINEVPGAILKAKTLNWQEDNFALTWAFVNYLHEHDLARRAVLPQPGDGTVGTSKLAIFKEIAKAVTNMESESNYSTAPADNRTTERNACSTERSEHLVNNTVILSYRNAFKNRLASLLKEKTTITNDIFGTGAGVSRPEDLEPLHANIWAEKREACPYYFELVQLINNHDTVVDGMATPGMPIDISVFESPSDSPSSTSTDSAHTKNEEGHIFHPYQRKNCAKRARDDGQYHVILERHHSPGSLCPEHSDSETCRC